MTSLWEDFFHTLNIVDEKRGYMSCRNVLLPDTIVYHWSHAMAWYSCSHDGRMQCLRGDKITSQGILKSFSIPLSKNNDDIVALLISQNRGSNGADQGLIEYLNVDSLTEFINFRPKPNVGLLQRYIPSKGDRNRCYKLTWAPKFCRSEMSTNLSTKDNQHVRQVDREVTFDGLAHLSQTSSIASSSIRQKLEDISKGVYDHFLNVSDNRKRLSCLTTLYRIDSLNNFWLMFPTELEYIISSKNFLNNNVSIVNSANSFNPNVENLKNPEMLPIHSSTPTASSQTITYPQIYVKTAPSRSVKLFANRSPSNTSSQQTNSSKLGNKNNSSEAAVRALLTQSGDPLVTMKCPNCQLPQPSNQFSWIEIQTVLRAYGIDFSFLPPPLPPPLPYAVMPPKSTSLNNVVSRLENLVESAMEGKSLSDIHPLHDQYLSPAMKKEKKLRSRQKSVKNDAIKKRQSTDETKHNSAVATSLKMESVSPKSPSIDQNSIMVKTTPLRRQKKTLIAVLFDDPQSVVDDLVHKLDIKRFSLLSSAVKIRHQKLTRTDCTKLLRGLIWLRAAINRAIDCCRTLSKPKVGYVISLRNALAEVEEELAIPPLIRSIYPSIGLDLFIACSLDPAWISTATKVCDECYCRLTNEFADQTICGARLKSNSGTDNDRTAFNMKQNNGEFTTKNPASSNNSSNLFSSIASMAKDVPGWMMRFKEKGYGLDTWLGQNAHVVLAMGLDTEVLLRARKPSTHFETVLDREADLSFAARILDAARMVDDQQKKKLNTMETELKFNVNNLENVEIGPYKRFKSPKNANSYQQDDLGNVSEMAGDEQQINNNGELSQESIAENMLRTYLECHQGKGEINTNNSTYNVENETELGSKHDSPYKLPLVGHDKINHFQTSESRHHTENMTSARKSKRGSMSARILFGLSPPPMISAQNSVEIFNPAHYNDGDDFSSTLNQRHQQRNEASYSPNAGKKNLFAGENSNSSNRKCVSSPYKKGITSEFLLNDPEFAETIAVALPDYIRNYLVKEIKKHEVEVDPLCNDMLLNGEDYQTVLVRQQILLDESISEKNSPASYRTKADMKKHFNSILRLKDKSPPRDVIFSLPSPADYMPSPSSVRTTGASKIKNPLLSIFEKPLNENSTLIKDEEHHLLLNESHVTNGSTQNTKKNVKYAQDSAISLALTGSNFLPPTTVKDSSYSTLPPSFLSPNIDDGHEKKNRASKSEGEIFLSRNSNVDIYDDSSLILESTTNRNDDNLTQTKGFFSTIGGASTVQWLSETEEDKTDRDFDGLSQRTSISLRKSFSLNSNARLNYKNNRKLDNKQITKRNSHFFLNSRLDDTHDDDSEAEEAAVIESFYLLPQTLDNDEDYENSNESEYQYQDAKIPPTTKNVWKTNIYGESYSDESADEDEELEEMYDDGITNNLEDDFVENSNEHNKKKENVKFFPLQSNSIPPSLSSNVTKSSPRSLNQLQSSNSLGNNINTSKVLRIINGEDILDGFHAYDEEGRKIEETLWEKTSQSAKASKAKRVFNETARAITNPSVFPERDDEEEETTLKHIIDPLFMVVEEDDSSMQLIDEVGTILSGNLHDVALEFNNDSQAREINQTKNPSLSLLDDDMKHSVIDLNEGSDSSFINLKNENNKIHINDNEDIELFNNAEALGYDNELSLSIASNHEYQIENITTHNEEGRKLQQPQSESIDNEQLSIDDTIDLDNTSIDFIEEKAVSNDVYSTILAHQLATHIECYDSEENGNNIDEKHPDNDLYFDSLELMLQEKTKQLSSLNVTDNNDSNCILNNISQMDAHSEFTKDLGSVNIPLHKSKPSVFPSFMTESLSSALSLAKKTLSKYDKDSRIPCIPFSSSEINHNLETSNQCDLKSVKLSTCKHKIHSSDICNRPNTTAGVYRGDDKTKTRILRGPAMDSKQINIKFSNRHTQNISSSQQNCSGQGGDPTGSLINLCPSSDASGLGLIRHPLIPLLPFDSLSSPTESTNKSIQIPVNQLKNTTNKTPWSLRVSTAPAGVLRSRKSSPVSSANNNSDSMHILNNKLAVHSSSSSSSIKASMSNSRSCTPAPAASTLSKNRSSKRLQMGLASNLSHSTPCLDTSAFIGENNKNDQKMGTLLKNKNQKQQDVFLKKIDTKKTCNAPVHKDGKSLSLLDLALAQSTK